MFPQSDQSFLEDAVWSVSDLNAYIRELIDIDYRLNELRVQGEISNFSEARSGHLYFTLKDQRSQIRCVMWSSYASRLDTNPVDGDAMIARGRVSVYEAAGQYQLYVEKLEPVGRGDLAIAFEELKEQLAAEGLFDTSRKKQIPAFPQRIGVVTSADAAALRDIVQVLRRRWPLVSVLVAPTLVQGSTAPAKIIQSLRWLDGRDDIDTIIIARGGGSMEDLWAFNDENLARAIFQANHPVIVGVGHETDFTIADFVADIRAPTPSAAAEIAVPDMADLSDHLQDLSGSLVHSTNALLHRHQVYLDGLFRALRNLSPRIIVDSRRQHVDFLHARLERAVSRRLDQVQGRLQMAQSRLVAVSPTATLARGYAIVKKIEGPLVRSVAEVSAGDKLEIKVVDGEFNAAVTEQNEKGASLAKKKE